MQTRTQSRGVKHSPNRVPAIIQLPAGKKALLRISRPGPFPNINGRTGDSDECHWGINANLLRDHAGINMDYPRTLSRWRRRSLA